ncbi:MAG TPA: hypothetical protein VFG15_30220 [Amycolatopsis sp.]|nr:hypothetical protein [Amycolatopsis sp.]
MTKQVRVVQTGGASRVEVDGVDVTRSLTRWQVTVREGVESHVELSGPDYSYTGPAEVTMTFEQPAKPPKPTAPELIECVPTMGKAITVPRSMVEATPGDPFARPSHNAIMTGWPPPPFLSDPEGSDTHVPVSSLSPTPKDPR